MADRSKAKHIVVTALSHGPCLIKSTVTTKIISDGA